MSGYILEINGINQVEHIEWLFLLMQDESIYLSVF